MNGKDRLSCNCLPRMSVNFEETGQKYLNSSGVKPMTTSLHGNTCQLLAVDQTVDLIVIWDTITPMSLYCDVGALFKLMACVMGIMSQISIVVPLRWRHNGRDGVSNHQPHDCLHNCVIQAQVKGNIKAPRHWPLWGEFTGDWWIPRTGGQ